MSEKTATRIGRALGKWIANALFFTSGVVYARHGWVTAAEVYAGVIIVVLALYGASKYEWRGAESGAK